jgi:hypothetical protein
LCLMGVLGVFGGFCDGGGGEWFNCLGPCGRGRGGERGVGGAIVLLLLLLLLLF